MKKKRLNKLIKILLWTAVLGSALWATKAFFKPGFYTSHDGEHQVIRLYRFHQALSQGQVPVRWIGEIRNGYGYPLFVFTYRFPWYIGEIFLRLGLSLTATVKALFVTATVLSAIFMYWWQKQIWGKWAGFLVAFAWTWAPYRFSVNLVRASLGEAMVLAFVPLFFGSLWKIFKDRDQKFVYLGALSFAIMLLSHAITTFLYLLPTGLFLIYLHLGFKNKKANCIKPLLGVGKVITLGLGISMFYLLPAYLSKKHIPALNPIFYRDHFLTLKQLVYSRWGYGFSMPGVVNDDMSFQIGIAQWGVLLLMLVLLPVTKILKKINLKKPQLYLALLSLVIFFASVFLMTQKADPVWQLVNRFFMVDFPWRLTSVAVLFASILAGACYFLISQFGELFAKVFLIGVFMTAWYTNRNHTNVNKYLDIPDQFYQENLSTSNSFRDEYTPKWASDGNWLKTQRPLFEVKSGKGEVLESKRLSADKIYGRFKINSDTAVIRINQIYFPNWKVLINSQPIKLNPADKGVMELSLKKGEHLVKAEFIELKLWKVANVISLFSLGLVFFGLWRHSYVKRN